MQGQINLFGKIEEKHFRLNLIVSPFLGELDNVLLLSEH